MSVQNLPGRGIDRRRGRVAALRLSTALVGTLATGGFGVEAAHAELPSSYTIPVGSVLATNPVVTVIDINPVIPITTPVLPGAPVLATNEVMDISLRRPTTVMDWGTFNLTDSVGGNPSSLNFTTTVPAGASVLNRVSAGNPSTIQGAISATNVNVWLVNTSGITVGAGGSFNGSALVLSASDIAPAAFGTASMALTGVNTAAPISLTGAGNLTATTGSIVVVGQQITANKQMSAANGEVALIAARDIALPFALGSPLSLTITKGTNLGTAAINVGGALSGQSVRVIGASEGGAIASLLNINTGANLVATAANGKVVIATKTDAATNVTVSGAAARDGITIGGNAILTAGNATGDIAVAASGAASITGTASLTAGERIDVSGRSVSITNGAISLTTASATAGDLTIATTTGDALVDTATATNGSVSITTPGKVAGRAALGRAALTANGIGTRNVTVDAGGTALLGAVNAGSAISLTAAALDVTSGTAGTSLTLEQTAGDLTFPGAATYSFATDLSLTAARDLVLPAAVTSPGAASLTAGRDVIGPGVTTTAGNIAIVAGRNVSGAGATRLAVSAGGAGSTASVTGTTGIARLGSVTSAGATTVSNAQVDVLAAGITLTSATATAGALKLEATGGDVRVDTASATGGTLTINAQLGALRGRAAGGRAGLTTTGAGADIAVDVAAAAFLGTADAAGKLGINAGSIDMQAGFARAGDAVLDSDAAGALGNVKASGGIAARGTSTLAAGALDAGNDIALRAGTTIDLTGAATAGDDIDLTTGGAITTLALVANGTGADNSAFTLTGAVVTKGAETAANAGANIHVTSTGGGLDLGSANTSFTGGGDIVLDGATSVTLGAGSARRSFAAVARGTGITVAGALTAGEDIGLQANTAINLTGAATAGDDIDLAAASITLASAQTTGGGADTRQISFAGPAVSVVAGEAPGRVGADVNATANSGNIVAQSLAANSDLSVTAAQNVRLDTATATAGNAALIATAGSVTGRIGTTPGASDPAFGRTNVSAATAGRNVTVTTGALAQLGTIAAGNTVAITAGSAAGLQNGAIDVTSATATSGNLVLTAHAVAPVAGTIRDGDIILGSGNAGGTATLSNTATGGTSGDISITDRLTATGLVTLQSARDVTIAPFSGGASGVVRSTANGISITAARSVFGIGGPAALPIDRGFGAVSAGGNLTVQSSGDVRIDSLTAGNNLTLDIAGSLTGRGAGNIGTAVSGGALIASGAVTVDAGNAAGNVIRLNTIQAGNGIALDAAGVAIGSTTMTGGNISASDLSDGFYFGALSVAGDLTFNPGGAIAAIGSVTTTQTFDPAFGAANLTATTGAVATLGSIGGVAQLGTVSGRSGLALAARGLTATAVASNAGAIALTATEGTLAIGTGTANTTATLVKQGGAIAAPGDDLRVNTSLSAGGNAVVTSNTSARLASVVSTGGNVGVTATLGDVSGIAISPAAIDGRPLAGFGRAVLTALVVDRTITVNAAGVAQLGIVAAGTGLAASALVPAQIGVIAGAINVTDANAANGGLALTATVGDVIVVTGIGGTDATILAANNVRIGTLTARTGAAAVTATAGDLTGLTLVAAPGTPASLVGIGATLSPGFGRALILSATDAAASAGNVAQIDTIAAGQNASVNAGALSVDTATAAAGALGLTATSGTLALGTGTAGTTATLVKQGGSIATPGDEIRVTGSLSSGGDIAISSGSSARLRTVDAIGGNLSVFATAGDVTGLANQAAPFPVSSLVDPLSPAFDGALLSANAAGRSITIAADQGVAKLTAITSGQNVTVTAAAVAAGTATATAGDLALSATRGSLTLGTGTAGGNAILTKSSDVAGQPDAIEVSALLAGVRNGGTGSVAINSSTDIHADAITARGGDVSLIALDGEVTGRVGGRAQLAAAVARDAGGADIAGSDRSIAVTTGTRALLGTLIAGANIDVTAGDAIAPAHDGAIGLTTATAARGRVGLQSFNDAAGSANGIAFTTVEAGTFAALGTRGGNGGDITGTSIDAGTDVILDAARNLAVASLDAGGSIAARAGGSVTGTGYTAGKDISVTGGAALTLDGALAGDDIDLTGSTIALRAATASGAGPDTSSVDFGVSPQPFAAETASHANANITLRSTAGAVTVTGSLAAQRTVAVTAATDANLPGSVVAGAPTGPGSTIISGDYTVNAGALINLGGSGAPVSQLASGAITMTGQTGVASASSPAALTLQANSDGIGAEALQISATTGAIGLADTTLIGGTLAGRQSTIGLTANGGTVSFAAADGAALAVRAGGTVTASRPMTVGNAARPADPVGGFNTVDIATTAGGISLTTATATGANHDIVLTAPGAVIARTLSATRNLTVTGGTVALADAAATGGALNLTATAGDLTLDTATAGTTGLLRTTAGGGDVIVNTGLTTGQAATIESHGDARLASVTAATGAVTVSAPDGEVTGIGAGGRADLIATTGPVIVTAGTLARFGTVGSPTGTGVTVTADAISIVNADAGTGALSLITDGGPADFGTVVAGGDIVLGSTGATTVDSLTAGGNATVRGSSVQAGAATATGGALLVDATAGDATLGMGVAGTTGTVQATGAAQVASLRAGGTATIAAGTAITAGTVTSTGVNVVLTAPAIAVTTVNAATTLTATGGAGGVALGSGLVGATALITSTGTTGIGTLTAGADLTARGVTVSADALTAAGGALLVDATGGNATLGTGIAGTTGTVLASGTAKVSSLTSAGAATVSGGTAIDAGTITSTGGNATLRAPRIAATSVKAGSALSMVASNGDATLGTGNAGGTAMVTATGAAGIGTLAAGDGATVTGATVTATAITATKGALDINATAGNVALGTGIAGSTGTVLATGSAAITTGLTAAGKASVTAGGTITAGTITSTGADVALAGQAITASTVAAGTTLMANASAGDVTLGTATAGGATTIAASGTARLGAVTATGRPITITASDAVLTGNVTGSGITVINKAAAGNALKLGNAAGGAGFSLDQAEVNRLNAATVTIDAGTGAGLTPQDIAVGALALDSDTGANRIDLLGVRRIDITGTVSADGSTAIRTIRFGGSANASDAATVIRVAAQANGGGGRIQMPTANLELRGAKIGFGQDQAFLTALGLGSGGAPLDPGLINSQFVSNPNSTLYNSSIGGLPYVPTDQALVSARTLTVKFTDYALFQNTGSPGLSRGVVLGGTLAAPIIDVPVLTISGPNPPDARGFSAFGSINGVTETGTALLGSGAIRITAVDPANARINGCVIGSGGGGCLVNAISQPVLSVFDSSRADVFRTATDFEFPFDPVIGTNNESLFGDVGTLGLEDIPLAPLPECDDSKSPECSPAQDAGQ